VSNVWRGLGHVQVKLRYHIRVMVPCYKEDIDIIKKTIEAAAAATLPAGCGRTIYLCDDGKDPEKRKWMQSLGPNFIYGGPLARSDYRRLGGENHRQDRFRIEFFCRFLLD
jgi:cellulose synthase/poly-beta-1,6-N-acetylglucosamine synthase-like glycosyltransferase